LRERVANGVVGAAVCDGWVLLLHPNVSVFVMLVQSMGVVVRTDRALDSVMFVNKHYGVLDGMSARTTENDPRPFVQLKGALAVFARQWKPSQAEAKFGQ
jgi:hypothetical protein